MSEFAPNPEHETDARPEPWQMTFEQFATEYQRSMATVAVKEQQGRLDPTKSNYEPLSDHERTLHEHDWRELSRQRGFTDADIAEYERWWIVSGQRDQLEAAINDPSRRSRTNHERTLYRQHIEQALAAGKSFTPDVHTSYQQLINPETAPPSAQTAPIPSTNSTASEAHDVW